MIPYFEANTAEELWPQLISSFRHLSSDANAAKNSIVEGRGGRTLEMLHTVLHLHNPRQRWFHSREPALNPAFALAEVIWILAGRQDAAFVNHWNPKLPLFAGDSQIYHGAYGWRLRHEHGVDQLRRAYEVLQATPENRQVVLEIWKPSLDLPAEDGTASAPDIPCNVCSLLKVRDGQLHWTQIMRSNDLLLGLPHNLVQWTTIQEVLAGWLELEVGPYTHISDSLHIYEKDWPSIESPILRPVTHEEVANIDVLSLPYNQFREVFEVVEQKAQLMLETNLSAKNLQGIVRSLECPPAYQNILLILAADTARRRGWHSEATGFVSGCTNPSLTSLWNRWNTRMNS